MRCRPSDWIFACIFNSTLNHRFMLCAKPEMRDACLPVQSLFNLCDAYVDIRQAIGIANVQGLRLLPRSNRTMFTDSDWLTKPVLLCLELETHIIDSLSFYTRPNNDFRYACVAKRRSDECTVIKLESWYSVYECSGECLHCLHGRRQPEP